MKYGAELGSHPNGVHVEPLPLPGETNACTSIIPNSNETMKMASDFLPRCGGGSALLISVSISSWT